MGIIAASTVTVAVVHLIVKVDMVGIAGVNTNHHLGHFLICINSTQANAGDLGPMAKMHTRATTTLVLTEMVFVGFAVPKYLLVRSAAKTLIVKVVGAMENSQLAAMVPARIKLMITNNALNDQLLMMDLMKRARVVNVWSY